MAKKKSIVKQKPIIEKEKAIAKPATYERCIVTFLDVLGFREIVSTRSAEEVNKIIGYLRHFNQPTENEDWESPIEMSRALVQSVSDDIIRARTMPTEYRDGSLFHEILDLVDSQIELVALGVLVRDGVTVGDVFVGNGNDTTFFDPALVRAYEIESQEAIFPRIVIGDEALKEFKTNKFLRSENNPYDYEMETVARFLAEGEGGTSYIDYLAAEREFDDGAHPEFLRRHAELIRAGRANASA